MNKKLYEWACYIAVPFLVHGCVRFSDRGDIGYAATCAATLVAMAVWYYYFVKYRPSRVNREAFIRTAASHGFTAQPGAAKAVASAIRQFPGFDDTSVTVDAVHLRESSAALFALARYATGGANGLHFGFLLLATFKTNHPRAMKADVVGGEAFAADDEREPIVADELLGQLRDVRYPWFVRNTALLFDFDTREIKEDFIPTLTSVLSRVPALTSLFLARS